MTRIDLLLRPYPEAGRAQSLALRQQCLQLKLPRVGAPHPVHTEAGGRPCLDESGADFSVTHSAGLWAIAILHGEGRVGLDLEDPWRRPGRNLDAIVERYFHPQERATWHSLGAPELRVEYFYRTWTCKEALAKARGVSLASLLGRPATDLAVGERLRSFHLSGPNSEEAVAYGCLVWSQLVCGAVAQAPVELDLADGFRLHW